MDAIRALARALGVTEALLTGEPEAPTFARKPGPGPEPSSGAPAGGAP